MDDQGGAGGAPLHDHDDEQSRRRAPHVAPRSTAPRTGEPDLRAVRAADTDEAARLDRPGDDSGSPHERRRPGREH
ncbi:hypothetical protein [Streptomyces xanthophaeus]|uniref:hypothetical protein n=1 Tax=Streptomyces xanthophaeus TaxID=67385 RepID=UPI00264A117B|nr:hypothetical protein [Streptomyces xanthophaeus]WKD36939.1 hypothetical protein KO717_36780 [Streptomyces xanthophaeus]